jgi:hypothetical protein
MTCLTEEQIIKVETIKEDNAQTGITKATTVSITSSNGLFYKVSNRKNSKSKTHLHLSYNGVILMDGDLRSSKYRADYFESCKDHILFKLSQDDLKTFLNISKNKNIGTVFMHPDRLKQQQSFVWRKKKLHMMYEDERVNRIMITLSKRTGNLNTLQNFLATSSISSETIRSANIDESFTMFELYNLDKDLVFYSTFESTTARAVFKYKDKEEQVFEKTTLAKYNKMLRDECVAWAIRNPKGTFQKTVEDFGFTDDMTYIQMKNMLKMIKI